MLQSNIWKYTIHLITNKRPFISILGVYLLTLPGTTPNSIGIMLLFGNLAGFIFEVPSGYISDKIGHKNALLFSKIGLLISTLLFLIGNSLIFFIFGAIFMNIAFAFHRGIGTVFMHETLRALGRESDYSRVMGKVSSIGFAIPIVLIIAIPFMVSISFRVPFVAVLIIDIIGIFVAASLVAPGQTPEEIQEVSTQNFKEIVKRSYDMGIFKYFLFTSVIAGAIIAISGFKDAYQSFLEVPIILYGIFFGTSRILVSVLLPFNHLIKNAFSFHQFLGFKLILGSLLIIALGLFTSPLIIVAIFILISAFNWSFKEAQNHYFLDMIGKSKFKATLLSVEQSFEDLVIAGSAYLLGVSITNNSYQAGFMSFGIIIITILLATFLFIILKNKQGLSPAT